MMSVDNEEFTCTNDYLIEKGHVCIEQGSNNCTDALSYSLLGTCVGTPLILEKDISCCDRNESSELNLEREYLGRIWTGRAEMLTENGIVTHLGVCNIPNVRLCPPRPGNS